MKNKNIFAKIGTVVGLTLGAFTLSVLADWTPPVSTPPTCASGNPGCDAPINVGPLTQSKLGALWVNTDPANTTATGLAVWGTTILNGGLRIPVGAGAGKVLTSNASGDATWQNAGTGGTGIPTGGIGGGCYRFRAVSNTGSTGATLTADWGNANGGGTANTCTCPSGYTSQVVAHNFPGTGTDSSTPTAYLCIKN